MSMTFYTKSSPEHLQLNVANGNGYAILRDLLGLGPKVECWGEISASAVLCQLAVSASRVLGAVEAPSDTQGERVVLTTSGVSVEKTCRVISGGRSIEQLERYVERLRALAEHAEANGEEISWD
jgi:hypothetical protein